MQHENHKLIKAINKKKFLKPPPMKILKDHFDKYSNGGGYTLVATKLDDFYLLGRIITPGDVIESSTTRKLSFDCGKTQTKINCNLEICVETVDVDLQDGILYLKGKTTKIHEHVPLNVYHTLNIPLDQKFKITRAEWTNYVVNQIHKATKESPEFLFVIFFEKDCVVSTLSSNQAKICSKHEAKPKNFKKISDSIKYPWNDRTLIVASALSIATDFYKFLEKENKEKDKKSVLFNLPNEYKNMSNQKAINKILTDKTYSQTFKSVKYVEDLREMEELFVCVEKEDPLVFFGFKALNEAFEYGALSKLYITDELHRPHNIHKRIVIEKLLEEAAALRAQIFVVPVSHELGEKLKEFGGIAGKLAFSYK